MAYVRLNEVELVTYSTNPKFLIEEDGDIKRISVENVIPPQAQADFNITNEDDPGFIRNKPEVVQADWNEEDNTSPAFILNKPESLGGKVIIVTENCGLMLEDGSKATPQYIVDEWNAGSTIRVQYSSNSGSEVYSQNVVNVYYEFGSGELYYASLYYLSECGSLYSVSCYK